MDSDTSISPIVLPEHYFATPVVGPAFGWVFRMVCITLVGTLAVYAIQVWRSSPQINNTTLAWLLAGGCLVMIGAYTIAFGMTTIDSKGIRSTGWFKTELSWHEMVSARYLRVPYSHRLLITRTYGPMRTFHAGDAKMEAAMQEIARLLSPRRHIP
jgi:hypothetical protein